MTGIFRTNNPLNTFLLFIYGILLKFVWLSHPLIPQIQESNGFLFNDVLKVIKPLFDNFPSGYFIVSYLLLFTQAVSFNNLIVSRKLMQKPNYLPAMSYLLVTSFFSEWNLLSAPLIINSIIIWIWSKMSNLNSNQHPKSTLYNIGIAIGICSFLYLPSLAFIFFISLSLIITRPPKAAEWFINIAGVLTPWYFLAALLFLNNNLYSFHLTGFGFSYPFLHSSKPELIGILIIIVLTIIGEGFVQPVSSKQILQVRKNWQLMLLYLIIALAIPLINNISDKSECLLVLVPVSAFIACGFYYPRIKWIPRILHWAMVGFVLYIEYFQK
ncbi:MAG TPA: hypothetical protein VMU83_18765 [Hanamia sp.]|nr:hypothetical protein [Hanamia sp.]